MDLINNLSLGFGVAFTLQNLFYAFIGCMLGTLIGVLPGIVGSIQALEALKLILSLGDSLIGKILAIDTTEMSFRTFKLQRDPKNAVTYDNREKIQVRDLEGSCAPIMSK